MKNTSLTRINEAVSRFANYLAVFGFSEEKNTAHISNFRQIMLWYEVRFNAFFDVFGIPSKQLERIRKMLSAADSRRDSGIPFTETFDLVAIWLKVITSHRTDRAKLELKQRLVPLMIPAFGLVVVLFMMISGRLNLGVSARSNDIIINGQAYTKEYAIAKNSPMVSYFSGGGVFSDSKYATMRLENFAEQGSNGQWTGPDFIIGQSNGAGIFYIQAGGNLYTAGTLNAASATVRGGLSVIGDLTLTGNFIKSGSELATKQDISVSFNGYYTASQVDALIAPLSSQLSSLDLSLYYTSAEVDALIAALPTPSSTFTEAITAPSAEFSGNTTTGSLTVLGAASFRSSSISWDSLDTTGSSLADLADILISNPTQRQALLWDASLSRWTNQNLYGAGAEEAMEDYVIYISGATCYAYSGVNGRVDYSGNNCSTVIQSAIDAAGDGGVISFRPGSYTIGTELTVHSRQTWWTSEGAVFTPSGDNRILNIHGADLFTLHGTLAIRDPQGHSTTAEAIRIDDMSQSYFDHISIVNYYRGISMTGTNGGTNENNFTDIYAQVRDRGLSLETSCHDNHFVHIWIKGPSPTVWATGSGIYMGTTGTQGGNTFDHVEILDMNIGMELPGAFETWFGNIIVDNPYGPGITIGGSCERLFFDTVWTSSGGDGIVIQGNTTSPADKIQIGKIYSWLNGNYGIRIDGYTQNITIGMATVQRNAKGFAIGGVENNDIHISSLTSYENTIYGVDGSGSTRNVFVDNAMIYDAALGLDYFTKIGGTRVGTGLFDAKGIAKIVSGQSTVTVSHGLENTPTIVNLTPYDAEVTGAYISAKDATSFTITVPAPVSAERQIGWQAESGRQLGPELLTNQSIEEGTDVPDNWYASVSNAVWSVTEFRSGIRSVELHTTTATADWRAEHFAVLANDTYRLRGFVKGTGSAQTFLTIRWYSDSGGSVFISEDNIILNSTYADWTEVKNDFVAPAGAQSADVIFRAPNPTTVDIFGDEFSVRKVI